MASTVTFVFRSIAIALALFLSGCTIVEGTAYAVKAISNSKNGEKTTAASSEAPSSSPIPASAAEDLPPPVADGAAPPAAVAVEELSP